MRESNKVQGISKVNRFSPLFLFIDKYDDH